MLEGRVCAVARAPLHTLINDMADESTPIRIETYQDAFQAGVVSVILPIQQSEFNVPVTIEDQPDEKNGFELVERADLPEAFPVMVVDTRFYAYRSTD